MSFRLNTPYVISETIDGETIIIHLGTGLYYSLQNGEGVWDAVATSSSVAEIASRLQRQFVATPGEIESGVGQLLDQLREEDLIVDLDDAELSPTPLDVVAADVADRRPFVAPVLSRYTDMQDLVLLDPVHDVGEAGWPNAQPQPQPQPHGV